MIVFRRKNIIDAVGDRAKHIPLVPAAIALVITAIFAAAYFVTHKPPAKETPSGQISTPEQAESQSELPQESATSSASQENVVTTEGDEIEALPEIESGSGAPSNAIAPINVAAPVKPAVPAKAPVSSPISPALKVDPASASVRDEQRQTDMRRLAGAQRSWYADHERYYTCSAAGGDCRGKANNVPSSIGSAGSNAVDPINRGQVCGRDFIYCGLDNTRNSAEFCYYAKLEGGGYYGVSSTGTFKRATPPASLADCAAAPLVVKPQPEAPQQTTPQERDAKRKGDMAQLVAAQAKWLAFKGQYYTCGVDGGDCQGKLANYPVTIGSFLPKTPADPLNSGGVCGGGYIYCGLDNSRTPVKFCYYAKLETGGYYAVSPAGSFSRSTPPATFGECGQPN